MMQDEISNLVRPLRAAMAGRFTPRENRHITLAFLGDTPASSLPDIEAALESATANAGEIVLKPDRLGKFGRCGDATLWLGLANDSGLMNLASDLHEELRTQHPFRRQAVSSARHHRAKSAHSRRQFATATLPQPSVCDTHHAV